MFTSIQLSRCNPQEVLDAYEDEVRRQRHHIKGESIPHAVAAPLSLCLQSPSMRHAPESRPHGASSTPSSRRGTLSSPPWRRWARGTRRRRLSSCRSRVTGDACPAPPGVQVFTLCRRLEARVASSRRILALAKRREDVGHRLRLFESGDEERRNSGAGVQLQVCLCSISFFSFIFCERVWALFESLKSASLSHVRAPLVCRRSVFVALCRGSCRASPTSCAPC